MNVLKTVEQQIKELGDRVTKLEMAGSFPRVERAGVLKKKSLSTKEFLMTKELKTETQKTLALGYYLEHTESMKSFNVGNLEAAFRSAKEKIPANMNDVVNRNIARGLIMEAAEKKEAKKAWVLTSTGEKYVEEELNK